MCFSASASIGAGVVLTVIGVATIKKANKTIKLMPFACIPFLFGIQQMAEGVLWLTLPSSKWPMVQLIATNVFLVFAQVVWPILVPVALLLLDRDSIVKNYHKVFVIIGFIVGTYMAYCLASIGASAEIVGHHIAYQQNYPTTFRGFGITLYALATVGPPLISQVKRMWILGLTILVSYVVTAILYDHYILSVWCFFASIISLSIYLIISNVASRSAN